jgi:hypothetical protein
MTYQPSIFMILSKFAVVAALAWIGLWKWKTEPKSKQSNAQIAYNINEKKMK